MRYSNTLSIEKTAGAMRVICAACKQDLAAADASWKRQAALQEHPAHELPGPYRTGQGLLLRQFSCPGCGALLDTELALPGEPFLEDRLLTS